MSHGPTEPVDPDATRALVELLDLVVPDDGFASAGAAGGADFLERVVSEERPEWRSRVRALVAAGSAAPDHRDWRWFCDLVNHGYYADPGNGGNTDAVSWRMLGWSPAPAGGWPELPPERRLATITPAQLAPRYDAVVVGSGAGGGTAAAALAEAGYRVLVVERGDYPRLADLSRDQLRTPRTFAGLDAFTGPATVGNPRVIERAGEASVLGPAAPGWGNNAMTVGGGTRVYGAQAWRLCPEDFAMAGTYGVPDGSALADWPFDYAELEPYYTRAEWEIGVSGSPAGDTSGAWRSRDYPMPPLASTGPARLLADAARRIALSTVSVPLLINSVPYGGRAACARCAQCVGFACPLDAKNGSPNTVLQRAVDAGAQLLTSTQVERIRTDARGQVVGVALVAADHGQIWRQEVDAGEVIVAAGAIESARLLLVSATDQEPDGLGNNTDQVGRYLQDHAYAGAVGIFADPINDHVGPGAAIATNDYRHHNAGIVGGGMIANEFVPTPVSSYDYLADAGLIPRWGSAAKEGMRRLTPRMQRIVGPIQGVTTADARVRLDPAVRDRFGGPVARLSGSPHPEDVRTHAFICERAADWLTAAGAVEVRTSAPLRTDAGPGVGQHQAGTCRMGTDPARSVTDPDGVVWGHPHLRVVDASLHVTNGGVNPVLTIYANALRVMDRMLRP